MGALWGPLGVSFWASLGPRGPLLGASWGPLEASWGSLGASWGGSLDLSVRVPPLGALLRRYWGPLWPFWNPLGPSWGPRGGHLGRLGAVIGASWSVLERRKLEKSRTPKTLKITMKINDLGILEASWEASWSALGASWRPLGPSWGHLGRLGALLGRLGGLLGPLGRFLGPSWPVLGPSGLWKIHARTPRSAQERTGTPRKSVNLGPQPLEY